MEIEFRLELTGLINALPLNIFSTLYLIIVHTILSHLRS